MHLPLLRHFSAVLCLLAMLPAAPVSASPDPRAPVIKALKDRYAVKIVQDDPAQFTEDFLLYLDSYFRINQPPGAPFYLHATQEDNPIRVRKEAHADGKGTDIYFAKNPARDLEITKLSEAKALIRANPRAFKTDKIKVTIEYKNTLFDHMNQILMDQAALKKLILNRYGVDVSPPAGDSFYAEFSAKELCQISKQFEDLTGPILEKKKLKKMIRVARGAKLPNNSGYEDEAPTADYTPALQTIRVSDAALTRAKSQYGVIDMVHEIGHSVWFAMPPEMQSKFCSISWRKSTVQGVDQWKYNAMGSDFIDKYATRNCLEDFAVHFSAYMTNSAQEAKMAPSKLEYMHKYIFPNIEYFNDAHPKAKLEVDSKNPDTTAPVISDAVPITESILYSVQSFDAEKVTIKFEIKNVSDDISGFNGAQLFLEKEDKTTASFFVSPEECVDIAQSGACTKIIETERKYFTEGKYFPKGFDISDKAGNYRFISLEGELPAIDLHGTKKPASLVKHPQPSWFQESLWSQLKLMPVPGAEAGIYFLVVPVTAADLKGIDTVSLHFQAQEPASYFEVTLYQRDFKFWSNGYWSIELDLRKVAADTYTSHYMSISYFGNEDYLGNNFFMADDKGTISIRTNGPPRGKVTTNLEGLVFSSLDEKKNEKNSEGGEKTLVVDLPINMIGIRSDQNVSVSVDILSPTGQIFSGYELGYGEVQDKSIRLTVPLPPNHAKGTYIIKSISLTVENKSSGYGINTGEFRDWINLLERGIRKTVELPNLNINLEQPK